MSGERQDCILKVGNEGNYTYVSAGWLGNTLCEQPNTKDACRLYGGTEYGKNSLKLIENYTLEKMAEDFLSVIYKMCKKED